MNTDIEDSNNASCFRCKEKATLYAKDGQSWLILSVDGGSPALSSLLLSGCLTLPYKIMDMNNYHTRFLCKKVALFCASSR